MRPESLRSKVADPPRLSSQRPLLEAFHLEKAYGRLRALEGVSLRVYPGEVLGIVGESGSGKSTLLRILHLDEPADGGEYYLDLPGLGRVNLFSLDPYQARQIRLRHVGMVYQNPLLGLRMHYSSSANIAERLILAGERRYGVLREAARAALEASDFPLSRMDDPPALLSGGMQQRVQLAKAVALKPALLLLDEPTTGLDATVQAAVLDTLWKLKHQMGSGFIVVSHDLGVIRMFADRVMVMRRGKVVEEGLVDQILEDPQHPYTQELVRAQLC